MKGIPVSVLTNNQQIAGEILKTGRTLRQAGIISIAAITVFYLLINLAYVRSLSSLFCSPRRLQRPVHGIGLYFTYE
jgi:hypothetical protein